MTVVLRPGDAILLAHPVGISMKDSNLTIMHVARAMPGVQVLGGSSGITQHIVFRNTTDEETKQ